MADLLNASNPITHKDFTMQQQFRAVMTSLQKQLPMNGSGSPEGFVPGDLYQIYLDDDGLAGSIQYRKMSASIAGDKTKGWILV